MSEKLGLAIIFILCMLDVGSGLYFSTEKFSFVEAWDHFTSSYFLGEATLDLVPVAVVRCLAMWCVIYEVIQAKRKPASKESLETPLLSVTHDKKVVSVETDELKNVPLLYRSIYRRKQKRLLEEQKGKELELVYKNYYRCVDVIVLLSVVVSTVKCMCRLFQASPFVNNPNATWFWVTVLSGPAWAIVLEYAFTRWVHSVIKTKMTAEEIAEAAHKKQSRATVKAMLRLVYPDWKLLLFAYTALALAAAGESTLPFLLGKMIDSMTQDSDFNEFHTYMIYTVGTAALTGIFTGMRGSTFLIVGARFSRRLQSRLFGSLLTQDMAFFDATKTGEITSRLSSDCGKVSDQVQLNVNVFLRSTLQACFVLGFMIYINWQLAMTAFVSVPSIVFVSRHFARYVEKLSKSTQQALADASATAEESLSSMKTVRSVAGTSEAYERYLLELAEYYGYMKKQSCVYAGYAGLTFTFLPQASFCIVLYYGANLIGSGQIQKGDLVSFVFYMQSLFAAFNSVGSIFTGLVQALGAAAKVFEWINRIPKDPKPPLLQSRKMSFEECKGDVALNDVTFVYPNRPGKPVLKGLSLHAKPGQVVALCGESGGGKSSCIALMERFYTPLTGSVTLDGVPVHEIEPESYHKLVAMVGQEPILYGRSIRENILFGFLASNSEDMPSEADMIEAAQRANAHDFISGFPDGYDTEVGERGTQLSGGQKQRIAIARALVRRPKVLILDEATSALDADSESVVQQAIDRMIAEGSMTVVVIAHRLSTIKNANTIVVVKDGQAVEQGTHNELVALEGVYYGLVAKQMHLPT